MKKILAIMLAAVMVFAMTACGKEESETEIANPVTQCASAEELVEATGLSIDAPKGATDIAYSYISDDEADDVIAQVDFTLDGETYCYRVQATGETSLFDNEDDKDATAEDLNEMMQDAIEDGAELAGITDKLESSASVDLESGREAIVAFNEGKSGFIAWIDVVPGFMYSLSMSENATQDLLMTTADKSFVPMQGNAG